MSMTKSVTEGRMAWSVSETSLTTGLSPGFIRKEIKAGRLRARRAGRRVLILDGDLRAYLGDPQRKRQ